MKVFFNTKAFDCIEDKDRLDITGSHSEAEIAVLGAKTIPFQEFTSLKAIYRFGVGRENIPDEVIKKNDPEVFFPGDKTKKILFESTADFTVYLIHHMYFSNKLGVIDSWEKDTRDSISNKNLLVIGLGNIGKLVADKMESTLNVCIYDVRFNQSKELKPLMENADLITLHLPMTEETRNFIDKEKLSWMKNDAVLINTARGPIVNEDALYDKIKSTGLRAAFDVFWEEPYNGKLKNLGNSKFFMTPHTCSQTIEYIREGFNDIKKIISQFGEQEK